MAPRPPMCGCQRLEYCAVVKNRQSTLTDEGESYIVLFHISQFDCFLFARNIRDLSMTPAICQAYHKVVWDVSASQPVCKLYGSVWDKYQIFVPMNIRKYSPWKNLTNIWTNEYIRLNIFEYIWISKYSSHTGSNLSNLVVRKRRFGGKGSTLIVEHP